MNPLHRNRPDIHSVTTVRASTAEDRHRREMQYLLAMFLRIVCIVVAVVVPGPMRWVAVVGAMLLPWFAVMIANNTGSPASVRVDPGPSLALSAGSPAPGSTSKTSGERTGTTASGHPTIVVDPGDVPRTIGPGHP